jgi:predicted nucleotidyltransferase
MMEPTLERIKKTILTIARKYKINVLAIVLYGSRARGDYSFGSDYDVFTLLGDKTTLLQFVQFASEFRMSAYKLGPVKLYACARKDFIKMMDKNPFLGAFCFIIASEGRAIHERNKEFWKLKQYVSDLPKGKKISLLKKCKSMSERLGSPKWVEYWERRLAEER